MKSFYPTGEGSRSQQGPYRASQAQLSLGYPKVLRAPSGPPALQPSPAGTNLCLREAQLCGQLGALGQRQVLGFLEAALQGGQLVAGVNGARLSDLLGLPVHHAHLGFRLLLHRHCRGRMVGGCSASACDPSGAPSRLPPRPGPRPGGSRGDRAGRVAAHDAALPVPALSLRAARTAALRPDALGRRLRRVPPYGVGLPLPSPQPCLPILE